MSWLRWRRKRGRGAEAVAAPRGFSFFGGRRFLTDAPYSLPKDDQEISRLDFQHYMLRYALKGNYAAPVRNPTSMLDVGCGTGRWAVEMATLFPSARVVGLDLVEPPALSAGEPRPVNFTFVRGNVLEGLPFPDGDFDFVHQRLLVAALPAVRWQAAVSELARVTRPGGWVELVEGDLWESDTPAFTLLKQWMYELVARRGIDGSGGTRVDLYLREAGLTNIYSQKLQLPMGRQAGRLGAMMEADLFSLVEAVRGVTVAQGIASEQAYSETVEAAKKETGSGTCVGVFYLAYGQRPA